MNEPIEEREYDVTLRRVTSESAVVRVRAGGPEGARQLAYEIEASEYVMWVKEGPDLLAIPDDDIRPIDE